jgi:RNA polymerase sigma-70 factor (ECF subfamily)
VDQDDQTLVERSRGGDVAAFEPLVEKYRQRVYRLAYNVVRDSEDAWDVAQEAFVRAWQALPNFKGQSAFYTWLFRIVMNVAMDRMRQRAARGRAFGTERVPEEEMERVMADDGPAPDDTAERAEQRARITAALDTLPEHHRTIIMLSDIEGLSYREIAAVLDIPMGTVMSRLHNARKRLRDALGPLLALLLVLAAALLPAPAAAQEVIRFGARIVLAGDGPPPPSVHGQPLDERLQHFVPKLRALLGYREYTSLERYRAEVPIGAVQRWVVPGDRVLEIVPEAVIERTVLMRVRLVRGRVAELITTIQAARGHPAIIGGPPHADGVLIIIVWADANPERSRR